MIRRPPQASPPPAGHSDGADDLEILHPEREIEIAGRTVTVREYGGIEGARLAGRARGVVHELAAISGADTQNGLLEYARLQAVFEQHLDAITAMVAQACDQPVEWVENLGDADLQMLLLTWWAVNGPFFVRRVLMELQMQLAGAAGRVGGASTRSSPPPGMATPDASAAAPAVN